jgi:phosphinothricin acetyltransferase
VADARPAVVRDAREADFAAIEAIYGEHVRHGLASFEEVAPSREELIRRWRAITERGLPYLVAEAEGAVQGYCYAAPYRERSAYRFTLENSVYVAPGRARGGLGTRLLAELIRRCELGPWRQMVAVIGDSGNASSIALHRKLGFRPVGTLAGVGFKHGRWVDSVFMQRPLGSGDGTLPSP